MTTQKTTSLDTQVGFSATSEPIRHSTAELIFFLREYAKRNRQVKDTWPEEMHESLMLTADYADHSADRLAELEAALERADDLMFIVTQARHADNVTGVAYRMVPDHTNHAIDQMEEYLETKEKLKQQALQHKGEA